MSQHDFNIANQGFPAFRTDLNNGLTALASNSSGATEPPTTYSYQWWYDTSTNILKMRNADNNAWIDFATFDQTNDLWSVTSLKATTEIRTPAIFDASGGNTATINGIPLRQGVLDPENRIINGAFDFWQRGTSFTSSAYGADRWVNSNIGGTVTQSRNGFAAGDRLGGNNPAFFLRQTVSGQSLSSDIANTHQRIEGVRNYAGQTITVLGWARRSSGSGNMVVEALQVFGTGGSPSATVTGISPTTITLTSSWEPFAATLTIPSIAGKTLGSDGNDWLQINFWTSAGSDFNARTNSLGLQTIGVDLWGIHIKVGTHTTAAVDLYKQPELGPELALCQRYLEDGVMDFRTLASGAGNFVINYQFAATKRATPTLSFPQAAAASSNVSGTPILQSPESSTGTARMTVVSVGAGDTFYVRVFRADAEL